MTVPDCRRRVLVQGIVQGVGFRPFVYNLATRLALSGYVRNDPAGVTIEVEGAAASVEAFLRDLVEAAPPLARIERVAHEILPPAGGDGFAIVASEASGPGRLALVSPDVGTCDECLAEIRRPGARRFGYALLAVSVFSATYPAWNAWRHPWLYQFLEARGWVQY